jgi:Ligand-gated ion channel
MNLSKTFLIFLLLNASSDTINGSKDFLLIREPENSNFIRAFRELIDELGKEFATINVVSLEENTKANDLKTSVLKSTKINYAIEMDSMAALNVVDGRKRNSIIMIESFESFVKIDSSINSNNFHQDGYLIFILTDGYFKEIEFIFDKMWKKNFPHTFAMYDANGQSEFLTFDPFENLEECGRSAPILTGKFEGKSLWKNKLKNFRGCSIDVTTYEEEDSIIPVTLPDGSLQLNGHNGKLLHALASALNFTAKIKLLTTYVHPWGNIYDNGTSYGALGEVYNNKTDLIVGDLFLMFRRAKSLDATVSFDMQEIMFIIPPGRLYTSFEKLSLPFTNQVWFLISFVFLAGFFTIYVVSLKHKKLRSLVFGERVTQPAMNMLIVVFGLQQTKLPTKTFARFILLNFLLFCLVIRCVYLAALYRFLQTDRRHAEVKSIDQMIQNNFKFYIVPTSYDLIKSSPEIANRAEFFQKDNFYLNLTLDGSEKIAAIETNSRIMTKIQKMNTTFILCKERLMSLQMVWYLRKNSMYTEVLNEKINWLMSSGIFRYWVKQEFGNGLLKKSDGVKLNKINLDHLSGIFYILFFGYFLATLAFIVEIYLKEFD